MREQVPSIGRIVHYRLSAEDVEQITRRRIFGRPAGAQAHIGNDVHEGEVFPMLIVHINDTRTAGTPTAVVNGQVFLDGNDVFWASSRMVGDQPGTFQLANAYVNVAVGTLNGELDE